MIVSNSTLKEINKDLLPRKKVRLKPHRPHIENSSIVSRQSN